jgi:alkylation response protein AidB-like acyl-CoA dehydrogenase
MHPEVTEEQAELKASVARFCSARVTPERLLAWEKAVGGVDPVTWQAIADLGWFGIGIAPELGGSGLGLIEVACVVEECARGLVPPRVTEAIRGAVALSDLEPAAAELEDVAAGRKRVTLAFDEQQARSAEHLQTRVSADGVSGEKWCVLDPGADWHVVSAVDGAGVSLLLVAGANTSVETLRTFDGSEQGAVGYHATRVERVLIDGPAGAPALRRLQRVQTALALAEMLGGMRAALDATVAYVQQREQFGQKIAVFQAVQHQIADMALAHAASRHLAWRAISRIESGTEEGTELATAAAFVGRSFKDITMTAHHLHGGAGYVVEHPLHYHSERAQALAIRYAPEGDALAEVAQSLLGPG